jgi:hypothetical protein
VTDTSPPPAHPAGTITGGRRVAIGCFTTALGVVSGGMIAVLVSMMVAFLTRAPKCPDIPTCDWYVYWGIGAAIGGLSLPAIVIWTISRPRKAD